MLLAFRILHNGLLALTKTDITKWWPTDSNRQFDMATTQKYAAYVLVDVFTEIVLIHLIELIIDLS